MRIKVVMFLIMSILSACLVGCSNVSLLKNQVDGTTKNTPTIEPSIDEAKEDDNIIPSNTSEPFVGSMDLDSETEKFFYGTWKVEKLLGFADSYNDASEYPTGQQVIGDEIIINKDFFSSKGFENYNVYQYELEDPLYEITEICYNEDSFYRIFKMDMLSLNRNDEVKALRVSDSSSGLSIPVGFLDVNDDRLILMLEATQFELKRVTE
ncbi:hypothetical protein SAMN04488542_11281 [Fontibacillus panacisegetis]|uniref:Lipocalin-like domain-containing protein n=1 Tax=Fontibacillus panacisegetis TaxID=670482 RepID=A0A1G7LVR5_9BACL|nr:hypothetical protein [Fontibacillus panacisegetis]SDF53511.1 hypothetical protein SAMN04488542_11281 [Fontibacillus panacisegetis]